MGSSNKEAEIFVLHRYFIWSNRMRSHLEDALERQGPMPDVTPEMSPTEREETEAEARAWFLSVFLYRSYWLAGLHVLVEGWQKLELHDVAVDAMLTSPFLDELRRHRNGVYHFSPTYMDKRVEATGSEGDARWVKHAVRLHDAFDEFFIQWFAGRGEWARPPQM